MKIRKLALVIGVLSATACSNRAFDNLNPYDDSPETELGKRDNSAILEGGANSTSDERARHALEVMGSYQRAQEPQPYKPVMRPPVVRLMWIPDHLNKAGDLVPAHYYFLRIKNSEFEVADAFDRMDQLDRGATGAGSATPWAFPGK